MKKKTLLILFISMIAVSIISCEDKKEVNEDKNIETEVIELNDGSICTEDNGEYINYTYNNERYSEAEGEQIIAVYDTASGNYLGQKDREYIVRYKDKEKEVHSIETYDSYFNLSPGGEYLSFFRNEESCNLYIMSIKDDKLLKLNISVMISGKYVDWLDDNTIVYYGIREADKKNGIFTYNIKEKKEKLLVEFDEGFVEFIKVLNDKIIYSKSSYEGEKTLVSIDKNGENSQELTSEIMKVYDIVDGNNDDYYILGSFKNTDYALYYLKDSIHKRLTYSFPSYVDVKKGLSKGDDGNILFIGSNNNKFQSVYKCNNEGAISLILDGTGEVYFVRRYSVQNS